MIQKLREKRGELAKEIRKMADLAKDEKHTWSGEDEARWTKINAEYEDAGKKLDRLLRAEEVDKAMEARSSDTSGIGREDRNWGAEREKEGEEEDIPPADEDLARSENDADKEFRGAKNLLRARNAEDERLALNAFCRQQLGMDLTDRLVRACKRTGINPRRPYLDMPLRRDYSKLRREIRAAMTTVNNVGGETIPEGFVPRFEAAMLAFGGVRQVAEVIRTATGNAMPWPTTNDTSNKGALLAEATTVGADQGIATSAMTLNAYKFSSKLLLISPELLEDSAFDLPGFIGDRLGERIGRVLNDEFSTANGSSRPNGIVNAATVATLSTGVPTTAAAAAITPDEILDLIHTIDPAYRGMPGCGFMFHDNVLLYLKKLKYTGSTEFVFTAPLDGGPARIFGYPYTINQSMASSITNNAKTVLFGDLAHYKIRDVGSIRLRRLVERYADLDEEGFIAFSRHDGDLLDAGTHPVKLLVQHA